MNPDSNQARQIFERAIEFQSTEERDEYLSQICGDDVGLKAQVDGLLAAYRKAGNFLEEPDPALVSPMIDPVMESTEIGPYKLLQQIGEGGFGVVYMAEQLRPVKRRVAIKIIKPGMDTKEVVARFEAERQALALMDHVNIAKVFDGGATDVGRPYFVMELVKGVALTKYCDNNRLSMRSRLELFGQVCRAIQHAHQKGIIHRDIKPSNVMVTMHDGEPVPKVIDFGVAKAISHELTEKTMFTAYGQMIGTPQYMSPEQAEMSGLDIDTRSDVYSLGVLLYELITGTTPLDKHSIQRTAYDELCRQIREVEALKPSARISTLKDIERSAVAEQRQVKPASLRTFVSGDLDRVVLKALQKDREQRYESPKELAADLERFLSDEPVQAVPPSPAYLAQKYVRRHKAAILTAASIMTLLIAATAVSTWQAIRATRFAKESNVQRKEAEVQRGLANAAKNAAEDATNEVEKTAEKRRRELYVSDMQLAAQIWNRPDGNQRQIEQLLAKWIPTDDQADLREFTWRYQWSLLHQNAMHAIFENVNSTAFTRNGNLVTAGNDGIRIWNESGKLVGHPYDDDASNCVLSSDGRWAVISKGQVVQLVEVSSGGIAHKLPGTRFSLSSDSHLLACWATEGDVSVWSIAASPPKPVAPLRTTGFATLPDQGELLLAPDGRSFVLRGVPDRANYFRNDVLAYLESRRQPIATYSPVQVGSWAWSPDGNLIAVGILLGHIRLQHVAQPENRIIIGSHGKQITSLAFSPDSKTLASGGLDGTIELWDVGELGPLAPVVDSANTLSEPNSLASGKAATGDSSGGPRLAPAAHEYVTTLPIRAIKAHVGAVRSISFSPDGLNFASTDEFGVTKRWDGAELKSIRVEDAAEDFYGGSIGILPEFSEAGVVIGALLPSYPAAESGRVQKQDRIVRIADGADAAMRNTAEVPQRELLNILQGGLPGSTVRMEIERGTEGERTVVELIRETHPSPEVGRVAFAPDGQALATCSRHIGVTVFDDPSINQAQRYPYRGASVAYSPDGRLLAMDDMFQIALWDRKGDRLRATLKTGDWTSTSDSLRGPGSLAFSPDGKYLAVGTGWPFFHSSRKSKLFVWDLAALDKIRASPAEIDVREPLYENNRILAAVKFTRDGRLIAADHGGAVRIWETSSWSLLETLKFPAATAIDVSPNGTLLALGFGVSRSPDAGIILWDLAARSYRRKMIGHRPFAIAFSPDGRTLVSTSERHDVVLWDVETGLQLRTMGGHTNTVPGAAFSSDGTKLATTDFAGNLLVREAATLSQIDRHPQTLRSLFRLGVVQNQERHYEAAEKTLCHLFPLQKELGDQEISKTRTQITTALDGQGKLPVIARHPGSSKVDLGEQVTLRVEAGGQGPWSFQWFRNGHRIHGATQQELLLEVASSADFGSYCVEVRPLGRDDVNTVASNWAHVVQRTTPDHPPPRSGEP